MVSRLQNRNTGYSENLFSHSPRMDNTYNSIDGATALKLDESYELDEEQGRSENNSDSILNEVDTTETVRETEKTLQDLPSGVSIESASYIENNNINEDAQEIMQSSEEEYTPKLFSEDQSYQSDEDLEMNQKEKNTEQLFEQNISEEDEFEIPAFLRKQKF